MDQTIASAPKPRWKFFLGLGCLGLIAFVAILFTFVFTVTRPVVDGADAFMGALRDGRYEQAYALAAPSLQQELGDAGKFAGGIGAYRPREWSWSQRSIRNGVGRVEGITTYADGRRGTVLIRLDKVGDQWRVTAFQLN